MGFSDERDYAEEAANQRLMDEEHETDIRDLPWLNTQMRHLAQIDPSAPYQAISEALDKSDIPPEYVDRVYSALYITIDAYLINMN